MDDIKKQKLKNIDKIVCPVIENFNESLNRRMLDKLYEKKTYLEERMNNLSRSELNRSISLQQLEDTIKDIKNIQDKIDINKDANIDIDDNAAIDFINNNPDIYSDIKDMIDQNNKVDQLEKETYRRK